MSKKFLVLLMVIVLLVPFASVNAQSATEVNFCEDLTSQADCDILTRSGEVMSEVSSFAFDLGMDYNLSSGMEGMENLGFGITGNGQLVMNLGLFSDMQTMSMQDPQGYLQQAPQLMNDLMNGLEGELNLTFDMGGVGMPAEMGEMAFNLLMVDGLVYMDFGALMGMGGQNVPPTWMYFENDGFMDQSMGMMGGFDFTSFNNTGLFAGMSDPAIAQQFITVTRLADSEVMGVPVAVFETTYNIEDMMNTPEVQEGMSELSSQVEGLGAEQSDMLENIFSSFGASNMIARQYIGLQDFYVYRFELIMGIGMDMNSLAELAGPDADTSDMEEMGNLDLSYDLFIDLSQFNQPVNIEAPENAQPAAAGMFGAMGQ